MWLELCLQWSPHPQLLDEAWCSVVSRRVVSCRVVVVLSSVV